MTKYLEIKPGSISEVAKKLHDDYQAYFKKELEKEGKPLSSMTDAEKKAFFNRVDKGYNAKNEATSQDVSTSLANKPVATNKTTLVAAPGGKENVIRIPVEKLADYKKKGYVEAEEFVPEAAKNPYAIGMAAAMKATGDKPPLKKSTIVKAHDIAKKIEKNEELKGNQKKLDKNNNGKLDADDFKKLRNEGAFKAIDTNTQELKRLRTRLTQLRDAENAAAGADTTNIEKQIHQTRKSILDIQKKQLEKQEDIDSDKMNKKQKEVKGEKEVINKLKEGKMTYKSYKKSIKKEAEDSKKMKKTLTDKPLTKIDVEPKLTGHN